MWVVKDFSVENWRRGPEIRWITTGSNLLYSAVTYIIYLIRIGEHRTAARRRIRRYYAHPFRCYARLFSHL